MTTFTRTDAAQLLAFLEDVCRYSPHTLRAYSTGLAQYDAFLQRRRRCARSASFADVIAYAASLSEREPATAALRLAAVRRLHAFLFAHGHVERDVARLVPSPRRVRGQRPAPSMRDVAIARASLATSRDRLVFGLLYGSALRISEARTALVRDVDLHAGTVTVLGKGRAWRTVEMDDETVCAAREWIGSDRRCTRQNPYLFPGYGGSGDRGPISETPIRKLLDTFGMKPHGLRRARGRALRAAGADPFTIQAIYGHASLSQTSKYVGDGDAPTLPDAIRAQLTRMEQSRTV